MELFFCFVKEWVIIDLHLNNYNKILKTKNVLDDGDIEELDLSKEKDDFEMKF